MCGPSSEANSRGSSDCQIRAKPPPEKLGKMEIRVEKLLDTPSMMARYTCASIMLAVFAVWGKLTFVSESEAPAIGSPVHGPVVPIVLTGGYLISLPVLRFTTQNFLSKAIDMKALLQESMIVYNVAQVLLNGWMVYRFISALVYSGHPFIGDIHTVTSGATFGVWVHYCDKYLEFFDTWFMVLRGKIDQVS
jgi:elongation of very long chain fatty acids protein 4